MFSIAKGNEEAIRISHPSPSVLQNDWLDGVVRSVTIATSCFYSFKIQRRKQDQLP